MSQESSASELEMAKEYSLVLAGTDDEDDRYLNAFCESIKQDKEYRKTSGFYNGVPSRQSTVCRSGGTTHPDLQTNTIHPL